MVGDHAGDEKFFFRAFGAVELAHGATDEGVGIENQARSNDGAAGETAAGRNMAVENHIDAEDHDNGEQNGCDLLQNAVILRLIKLFLPGFLLQAFFVLFLIIMSQKKYISASENTTADEIKNFCFMESERCA